MNPGRSRHCHRGATPPDARAATARRVVPRPRPQGWKAEGERRSGSQDTPAAPATPTTSLPTVFAGEETRGEDSRMGSCLSGR
ncbi:hypothetical protein CS0771_02860 [Catellatospora sp. IY07-71]|nr:hypothetical protein CS0771_02860 [Catellatospora sp. IY07-71]